MTRNTKAVSFLVAMTACAFLFPVTVGAQEKEAKPPEKPADQAAPAPPKEESSVTDHTIKINGQTIPYKATAQTILLKND